MSNEPEKSPNGVFVDTKTGDVVESEPEEGIQLVPPGGEIDPNAKVHIAVAQGLVTPDAVGIPVVVPEELEVASTEDEVETADEAKTVKSTAKRRG